MTDNKLYFNTLLKDVMMPPLVWRTASANSSLLGSQLLNQDTTIFCHHNLLQPLCCSGLDSPLMNLQTPSTIHTTQRLCQIHLYWEIVDSVFYTMLTICNADDHMIASSICIASPSWRFAGLVLFCFKRIEMADKGFRGVHGVCIAREQEMLLIIL